jgi:hypothetical protein
MVDTNYVGTYLDKPIFDAREYIQYGDSYFLKDTIKKRVGRILADHLDEEIEVLDISIAPDPSPEPIPRFHLSVYGRSAANGRFFKQPCKIGFLSESEMGIVLHKTGTRPRLICIEGDDEAIYLIPPTHLVPFTDVELSELLFGEG